MGIVITFIYDLIRLLREIIPHNTFFISIEDILFWIFTCCAQFLLLYKVNNGMVRWYSIAGAFLGMILYKKSIGQYMVVFLSQIIRKILHIVLRIFIYVISPIRWLIRKTKPVFMRIAQNFLKRPKNAKNKLTDKVNGFKISLYKRKYSQDEEVEL
ncbi:MAG: spore cortex biosynthesis protein YabQ [Lachnospiraceae bacterium]|nr:spore cortex biosynthesis protein YabQ [Lachnospiraceae bacterium]